MSFNSITDFSTSELLYCSPIVALLHQNSSIAHRLSCYYARTPLSLTDCRVISSELLYRSPIVVLFLQNSFIAHRLSCYYVRTPLSLTDCRVITSELLYRSPIVALPNLTMTLLVKLSNTIKLAGAVNLKKSSLSQVQIYV